MGRRKFIGEKFGKIENSVRENISWDICVKVNIFGIFAWKWNLCGDEYWRARVVGGIGTSVLVCGAEEEESLDQLLMRPPPPPAATAPSSVAQSVGGPWCHGDRAAGQLGHRDGGLLDLEPFSPPPSLGDWWATLCPAAAGPAAAPPRPGGACSGALSRQPDNLTAWQPDNLASWQPDNLTIWQSRGQVSHIEDGQLPVWLFVCCQSGVKRWKNDSSWSNLDPQEWPWRGAFLQINCKLTFCELSCLKTLLLTISDIDHVDSSTTIATYQLENVGEFLKKRVEVERPPVQIQQWSNTHLNTAKNFFHCCFFAEKEWKLTWSWLRYRWTGKVRGDLMGWVETASCNVQSNFPALSIFTEPCNPRDKCHGQLHKHFLCGENLMH